jgi:hypothetical protein
MFDFDDFLSIVEDGDLEEIPVDIDTFIQDERYLNRPEVTLSDYQRQCILASTQIYRKSTLLQFLSDKEAEKRWQQTCNEVILQLGKGSGKDFMSAISCAYMVYLLLCLKDPARYYNKPSGDTIDILNIAQNSAQASNVFFANVSRLIQKAPWFVGRYETKGGSAEPAKANQIDFDKNVTLYSGHSEREAWEGYNVIMVILDEIDGFANDSASGVMGKTAAGIYDMYRASVDSRFGEFGKVLALSFPRYKGSWIQTRYDQIVAAKTTVVRTEILKLDPDLPDGFEGNEIKIEWDEDHIEQYKYPKMFALKRPTWDVNPHKHIEEYARAFFDNYIDTLSRTACMPPDAIDAFFKDTQKVNDAFTSTNIVSNDDGRFDENLARPDDSKLYFVHVDLARKHDRCAVAMGHVEGFVQRKIGQITTEPAPLIKIDSLRYWIPKKDQPVDFTDVRQHILDLARAGYNIRLVTFDQWESADMRKYLEQAGLRTDKLSVAIKHYTDFAVAVAEGRLEGPDEPLLREELLALRIMQNGKIDHMRQGYKDLSDATCGAIFNAIALTPRERNTEVEVRTYKDVKKQVVNDTVAKQLAEQEARKVIRAPSAKATGKQMPKQLFDWINSAKVL